MRRLLRNLQLSRLLFVSHLILVICLLAATGYSRYQSEWNSRISHAVEAARNATNPIIDLISFAASGINYTSIKMDTSLKLYQGIEKLLYFEVQARSDYSESNFSFAWSAYNNELWQTRITADDLVSSEARIRKLEQRLIRASEADQTKLSFLLNRANEHYQRLLRDQKLIASSPYQRPDIAVDQYRLNPEEQTLELALSLRNKNGGTIWLQFDASELLSLRGEVLSNIAREGLIALLISMALILWATRWIVRPLKRLSATMDQDIQEIDLTDLPELVRNDEIGVLARRFDVLVRRSNEQFYELQQLSAVDTLTGLGSRYLYDTTGDSLLKQSRRNGTVFGMLVCDIDNFKAYNDYFGHSAGDLALKQVGRILGDSLHRQTDLAFRYGGEEFVILLQVSSVSEALNIAERIRKAVYDAGIPHPANTDIEVISVSMGIATACPDNPMLPLSLADIFRLADQALYRAKHNGRNRIVTATATDRQLPGINGGTTSEAS